MAKGFSEVFNEEASRQVREFIENNPRSAIVIFVISAIIGLITIVIFVVRRRRRYNPLRKLLGKSFSEENAFIRPEAGIAVDQAGGRFGFVDPNVTAIVDGNEIIDLQLEAGESLRMIVTTAHEGLESIATKGPSSQIEKLERVYSGLRII